MQSSQFTPPPTRSDQGCGNAEPPQATPTEPLEVQVANQQSRLQIDDRSMCAAVRTAFAESHYRMASVSVAVVESATIHEMNRRYLGHDYVTDVISFKLEESADALVGEIVVCAEVAAENAAEAGWNAADEIILYVVHGALHLIGYDDQGPSDARAMRLAEARVLDRLGVARSANDLRWSDERQPAATQRGGNLSL